MKKRNLYGFFGVAVAPGAAGRVAAPVFGAGAAAVAGGAAEGLSVLYASTSSLVMMLPCAAHSTGVCGLETSRITAYPLALAYFSSVLSILLPMRFTTS